MQLRQSGSAEDERNQKASNSGLGIKILRAAQLILIGFECFIVLRQRFHILVIKLCKRCIVGWGWGCISQRSFGSFTFSGFNLNL